MAPQFTVEQVLALAPDPSSASAGKGLAAARKWVSMSTRGDAIWGECQGSGSSPYQVRVDLTEPACKCSCPSRKFPCKHGLGLLLLWAGNQSTFKDADPPGWVTEWLESRAARSAKKAERAEERSQKEADPAAQAKRAERRESRIQVGVEELRLWMRDLVRRGLADAQTQSAFFWDRMAARLVDAQAPGLARYVRTMGAFAGSGDGWQDRLLKQAGSLHLLLEAWGRLDQLEPDLREEVRSLVGITQSREDILAGSGVRDDWFVWAQYTQEMDDGLRVQRTWLYGSSSQRRALTLSFARPGMPFDTAWAPGSAHPAELAFYPSTVPLRALAKVRGDAKPAGTKPAFATLAEAFAARGADLARNPWIERTPLPLSEARLASVEGQLYLVDREDRAVAVRMAEEAMWRAFAITAGKPALFFGEWDGTACHLLAAEAEGKYTALRT